MTTNGNMERPLPDGWTWTIIGEVAKTTSGGTPSRKRPEYYGGVIPWVKSGELGDSIVNTVSETITDEGLKNSSAKIFPKGTALVALYGATVGKTGILGIDAATNQAVCAILPENGLFTAKYMTYWLRSQRNNLIGLSSGGAQPNISQTIVKAFHFPLAPPNEQEHIVAEIEKQFTRLDQAVASLKRLQSNLARYKASVLKAACEGRLVPQDPNDEPAGQLLARILAERRAQWEKQEWQKLIVKAQKKAAQAARKAQGLPARIKDLQPGEWESIPEADYARFLPKHDKWKEKYKEPAGVETAVLPDLPDGWVWTSVAQLGDILGGLTKNAKRGTLPTKMPYLRVANVYANELNLEDVATIGTRKSELKRVLLEENDLLVVEGNGSIDQIGRVALWNGSISPCVHQNHLIKVRFLEIGIADFVLYWLLSPDGRKAIQKVASSTSGLHTLSLSKVGALLVPLPPLAEQKRIVAEVERRLSVITATEQAVTTNLARAERLRQSILGRAFTGQLVPQTEGAV